MATMDDLPNETLAHVLRMGLGADDSDECDAFLAAVRLTARRWYDAASIFWRPVTPHAYGRCMQFLRDINADTPAKPSTKRRTVVRAVESARRAPAEAGPALDSAKLRPYDLATALVEAFGARAPESARRRRSKERCPACDRRPDRCVCLCTAPRPCWGCDGTRPLAHCKKSTDDDVWDSDYMGRWGYDLCNAALLASTYPRLDLAWRRHSEATASCWSRLRYPTLAHWRATRADPTQAAIYVARCAQTLVSHALADAEGIGRMTCSAVVRRAHRLVDYRACLADRKWDIGDCDCGGWTFDEKRCACDNVKYCYDSECVEIDDEYHLDRARRHGSVQRC